MQVVVFGKWFVAYLIDTFVLSIIMTIFMVIGSVVIRGIGIEADSEGLIIF